MLSIYRRVFFTDMPVAIFLLIIGIATLLLPKEVLIQKLDIWQAILLAAFPVLLIGVSIWYKEKNINRFEPYDDLTIEHVNRANEIFVNINQIIGIMVVCTLVFLRLDTINSQMIVSLLYIYLGLEKIIRYILFVIVDKREMRVQGNE